MRLPEIVSALARFPTTIWTSNAGFDRLTYLGRGAAWQLRKRLGHSFVAALPNGAKIAVHPATAFSGIFYSRWVERSDTLFIRSNSDLGRTFVDVGANVGIFSAQLFDKFDSFVLIEPSPSSLVALRETCALNPGISCRVVASAVSDHPGEGAFIDDGLYATTSRLQKSSNSDPDSHGTVAVDTLDNILGDETRGVVLKLDIEGFEEQAFDGARRLLRDGVIRLAMFERLGRTNLGAIRRLLSSFDYVIFRVREDGSLTRDEREIFEPLVNLFTCPANVYGARFASKEHRGVSPV